MFSFQDCYFDLQKDSLRVGNARVERIWNLRDGMLYPTALVNKRSGYQWNNEKTRAPMFALAGITPQALARAAFSSEGGKDDLLGASEPYLRCALCWNAETFALRLVFSIYPDTPFLVSQLLVRGKKGLAGAVPAQERVSFGNIEDFDLLQRSGLPAGDVTDILPIDDPHIRLHAVKLADVTDRYDNLAMEHSELVYSRGAHAFEGNFFIADSYLKGEACMMVKESPSTFSCLYRNGPDYTVNLRAFACVTGAGLDMNGLDPDTFYPAYAVTVGACASGESRTEYKALCRRINKGRGDRFIISNNWGDRGGARAVTEANSLAEIAVAKKLGVEIMQIDAAWSECEKNLRDTVAPAVYQAMPLYERNAHYWRIDAARYPHGFRPLLEAMDGGMELGVWMSPDHRNSFATWERDAEVMIDLYRNHGVRAIKLDIYDFGDKRAEANFYQMIDRVYRETGGGLAFQFDATACIRQGHLPLKQYGTVFVENRYTDWRNYYPHTTLKNLWQLSSVLPARRLLIEVLNTTRPTAVYPDDPLSPHLYPIEYIFAIAMPANPLLWMEMAYLPEETQEKLAKIIAAYKTVRKDFWDADVRPIGGEPDGVSFTGFHLACGAGCGYLLLFRERAAEDRFTYTIRGLENRTLQVEYRYSNLPVQDVSIDTAAGPRGEVRVTIAHPRSFVLAAYRVRAEGAEAAAPCLGAQHPQG